MTFTLEQVGWNVTQLRSMSSAECEMLLYCRRLSRWLAPSTASSVIHLLTLKIKHHYLLVFDMPCMQASTCFNLFQPDPSPTYHTYLEMQLLNGHDVLFAEICFGFIPCVLCVAPTATTWSGILTAWYSTSRFQTFCFHFKPCVTILATTWRCCVQNEVSPVRCVLFTTLL